MSTSPTSPTFLIPSEFAATIVLCALIETIQLWGILCRVPAKRTEA